MPGTTWAAQQTVRYAYELNDYAYFGEPGGPGQSTAPAGCPSG